MIPEKTLLFIASTRAALKNNVKHYNNNGDLLATSLEILKTLRENKQVRVNETERVEITTVEEELSILRKELGC